MDKSRSDNIYEFEDFHLDAAHLLLYQNGRQISLAPKVVETLLALVERHGEVLSKDELMEIVWADSIVEESNLSQNLYLLRKILNETADGKPLIETLKRRGYRFNGDVLCIEPETAKNFSPDNNQSAAPEISINNHHSGVERQGSVPASADRKINEPGKSETGDYHFQISEPADAFQACQLARIHYQRLSPPDLIKSRVLLEKAIRLDAGYAPAYVAFAEQSITEAIVGLRAPAECFAGAKDAIARASELNANSAEFYAAAGYADLICDWNFTEAGRNLRKSLEINSHHAYGNNYLGQVFMFQRRFDEAETYLRRARKIEPTNLYHRGALMINFFLARNYQKLIEESEKTLALYPQFINAAQMRCWALEQTGRAAGAVAEYEKILSEPHGEFARRWIGYAYALVGDEENARATAAKLTAESREHYVSPIYLAMLYAGLNESAESCFYLEKAAAERDPWLLWIAADGRFDNLRSVLRFQKLEKIVAPPSCHEQNYKIDAQTNGFFAHGNRQSETGKDFIEKTKDRLHLVLPAKLENTSPVESKINKMRWLSATICAAVLLFGAFFLWQKRRTDSRFEKIELKALTASGNIQNSAISPDGKLLAYAKNENGKQSLWIRRTQLRESEIRLTEPTDDASFVGLKFTPDGNKIYFLLGAKNDSVKRLYAISTLGGQTAAILDDVDSPPAFAPDGRRLAFMHYNVKTGVSALFIADADGSDSRELTNRAPPLGFKLRPLAWSPDGKNFVCVVFERASPASAKIVEIDAETGAENVVSDRIWNDIYAVAWTKDETGLIFTASEPQKPLYSQIWFLPYPNGAARRLTNDFVIYGSLSVAADSGEIIARREQTENQVWLIDATSPTAAPRRVTPNNSDGEHGLAWTPDNHLIFSSVINGSNGLQKLSGQDSAATLLATGESVFSQPCATADNRYIVYISAQAGHYFLWRVGADGKNIKQLTAVNVEHPTCSPDASRIFYTAAADGETSLWENSIDGDAPRLVSEKILRFPQISPDGTRIACYYRADAKAVWQMAILTAGEDRVLQTFDLPKTIALNSPFVWSKDNDGLIFIETREGVANLWRYSLNGQTPTRLTNFADDALPIINNFAVSPDGSQIALTRAQKISDIVQIVGETQPPVR